ncbi:MAG TPA: aldehyde dehydrogenase family protein [Micromonosporaceae bacterium]|jgi:acyl-CoA reductase-like NAD-dependent aldehyde dehydrogenase|nr:aldehyde dehydrogenase family protein [Micromonosporaceae bacterium]
MTSDLHVPAHLRWESLFAAAASATPEGFGADRTRNLVGGEWVDTGEPSPVNTSVDGTTLLSLPMLDAAQAGDAVQRSAEQHREWGRVPVDERKRRVSEAIDSMSEHSGLLAHLLMWEIGKPWRSACADVDRALDGVRWYLEEIDGMLVEADGRTLRPLPGPVSNIASWNYPMSVLVHAELVQLLAGNAVIAKTPTQGGGVCLTLAHALMHRAGLPVTLLSGRGSQLSEVLVRSAEIGAVAFVGGRDVGGQVAAQLVDTSKRHMLEMEGLNAWGVWEFSQWDVLAQHIRKGFEYGKQRCTAYPRFVVQRDLVDKFLETYLPVVRSTAIGHPFAVANDADPLPELDFGPLISAAKVTELHDRVTEALRGGAVPLYRGELDPSRFLPGQNTDAYVAPVALLAPPGSARLMHAEPFGPVDTIVVVDTEAELLAAMNASNGALVASLACDDEAVARKLAEEVRAFKVGINKPRSRGDRAEPFGGLGASWKGAFVGGEHLVRAVSDVTDEQLYGNFPGYRRYPET